VLIKKDGSPVLTDFEISKTVLRGMGREKFTMITDNQEQLVGTKAFLPPEAVYPYRYRYEKDYTGKEDTDMYVRSKDGTNINTIAKTDSKFYSFVYKTRDCWALGIYLWISVHMCMCSLRMVLFVLVRLSSEILICVICRMCAVYPVSEGANVQTAQKFRYGSPPTVYGQTNL